MHKLWCGAVLGIICTLFVACGGEQAPASDPAPAPARELVVERDEADGVTTVRNITGSKWETEPTLEEVVSIGAEAGEEPYMLGQVAAGFVTAERIYLADVQGPVVRAYDRTGEYLFDLGGPGQGPGEYRQPMSIVVDPEGTAYVTDLMGARINLYDKEGAFLETWGVGSPQNAVRLFLDADGGVYTQYFEMPSDPTQAFLAGMAGLPQGVRRVGADGMSGDPIRPPQIDFEPLSVPVSIRGQELQMPIVPFAPAYTWDFAPSGHMIAGVGGDYRFEIVDSSGARTVIEKSWEPVSTQDGEIAFQADMMSGMLRAMVPDFQFPLDVVPRTKPAFKAFRADRVRRLWVAREGLGEVDPECGGLADMPVPIEQPGECWSAPTVWDVFELDSGEFLGTLAPDQELNILYVDDEIVLAVVTDALGTQMVKGFRLGME